MSMRIPRTVSAPNTNAPFSKAYGAAPHIAHHERTQPPPSIPMPTPSAWRPTPAAPPAVVATPAAPAAVASPKPIVSPTPSVVAAATVTPVAAVSQFPSEGKPKTLKDIDAVWGNAMANCTDEAGEEVMKWAREIWNDLPPTPDSVYDKPEHLFARVIFGGQPVGSTKRHILVKERTLPHQVMGILSRVTPDNYDLIEQELLNLPIRQSEDSEIGEIVNVFFKKAIRPEDSIYAPQYARLIQALVKSIEAKEKGKDISRSVAKVIRSAIVNRCKAQYENLPELEELNREVSRTDDPEVENRRRDLMAKLKANIGFLGQLFAHQLIVERVVVSVLYSLLWGSEGRTTQDFEIEHFYTLLEVCGPKLSQDARDQYQPHYISTLNDISVGDRCTIRTKVLALNCKEFIENGYVRRGKKSGPMKLDEYNRQAAEQQMRDFDMVGKQLQQQQQRQQALQQSHSQPHVAATRSVLRGKLASPTGASPSYSNVAARTQPAQPQSMTLVAFNKVLDEALTAADGKAFVLPDLKTVPAGSMLNYFIDWSYRFLGAKKWETQRRSVGSVVRAALEAQILDREQVTKLTRTLGQRTIPDCEDIPNIFEFYCEVIESALDIFGYASYNNLLRDVCSFRPSISFSIIKRCVTAVVKRSPDRIADQAGTVGSKLTTPVAAGQDFPSTATSRVYLLPHMLRFIGYTSTDLVPTAPQVDGEECLEDDTLVAEREEHDILDIVLAATQTSDTDDGDVEMLVYITYLNTCAINEDGIDIPSGKEAKHKAQAILPESVKADKLSNPRNTFLARKVLSATFTYGRFNKKLLETLIGTIAKVSLDGAKIDHCSSLLMEVYSTWLELDCKPYGALDTCLDTIFSVVTQLVNSTAGDNLFNAIEKNGHKDAVPLFVKRRGNK